MIWPLSGFQLYGVYCKGFAQKGASEGPQRSFRRVLSGLTVVLQGFSICRRILRGFENGSIRLSRLGFAVGRRFNFRVFFVVLQTTLSLP